MEHDLQKQILAALEQMSGVKAWRSNTGRRGHVSFGLKGSGDITGLVRGGRRLEIEVKGPDGQQSHDQCAFQHEIQALGGIYILARDLESTLKIVQMEVALCSHYSK